MVKTGANLSRRCCILNHRQNRNLRPGGGDNNKSRRGNPPTKKGRALMCQQGSRCRSFSGARKLMLGCERPPDFASPTSVRDDRRAHESRLRRRAAAVRWCRLRSCGPARDSRMSARSSGSRKTCTTSSHAGAWRSDGGQWAVEPVRRHCSERQPAARLRRRACDGGRAPVAARSLRGPVRSRSRTRCPRSR